MSTRPGKSKEKLRLVAREKRLEGGMMKRVESLKVVRDFPADMNDQEALVLMLAVHCTADVVGLSVDPPLTGSQVRAIIEKYRPYYTKLKESANDVLRSILEDGTMIALGRIRSAVCRVPLTTVNEVRLMLSVMIELKRMAELMPAKNVGASVSGAEADRFERLQDKLDSMNDDVDRKEDKEKKDAIESSEAKGESEARVVAVGG